jgi:hypothetical protein
LDLFQFTGIINNTDLPRSSKRIPLIISKAGGKHCRFSHKNYTMKYKLNIDTLVIGYTGTGDIQLEG